MKQFIDKEGLKEFSEGVKKKYALKIDLDKKVNIENGKGLSTNDFTNEDKAKVGKIPNNWLTVGRELIRNFEWRQEFFNSFSYIISNDRPFLSGIVNLEELDDTKETGIYFFLARPEDLNSQFMFTIQDKRYLAQGGLLFVQAIANKKEVHQTLLVHSSEKRRGAYIKLDSGTFINRAYSRDSRQWSEWRILKTQLEGLVNTKADKSELPTQLSQLANDLNFKTEVEIKKLINDNASLKKEIVTSLPQSGKDNVIYLLKDNNGKDDNNYFEYLWINNKWELIGNTKVDLTNYVKKDEFGKQEVLLTPSDPSGQVPIEQALQSVYEMVVSFSQTASKVLTKEQADVLYTTKNFVEDTLKNKIESTKTSLIQSFNESVETRVAKNNVVNNLTTGGVSKVLSAEQGKILKANLNNKVDKINGKGLSTNDFTNSHKQKVDAIPNNPKYTDTTYDLSPYVKKTDLPTKLSQLENDENFQTYEALLSAINSSYTSLEDKLANKVDKVEGKRLSANDFTNNWLQKLKLSYSNNAIKITTKEDFLTFITAREEEHKRGITIVQLAQTENLKDTQSNVVFGRGFAIKDNRTVWLFIGNPFDEDEYKNQFKVYMITNYGNESSIKIYKVFSTESIDNKVDKISGKSLSTNDFTNELKAKLEKDISIYSLNSSDLDTINKAGFYSCRSCKNKPLDGHAYATLIVSKADSTIDNSNTDTVQIYIDKNNDVFIRNNIDSSNWVAWKKIGGELPAILSKVSRIEGSMSSLSPIPISEIEEAFK
ncbi:pyocin knob domain-containing protein [Peptoniphilus sp. MSJ-1]|uniref:Pyocin knob domain-containing protein n=1 Tax=Peptoniphilus ovalis TaxID=2841503 RepID=A0ABS6FHL6_9FIRM|nr:pyocin knob domain-containing protein [Peptoniphilus ovalis]MBU5669666.1 pyocin knob domain-containing protein [Peptoniphilus ovalis]